MDNSHDQLCYHDRLSVYKNDQLNAVYKRE